jgi:hypothetical protein
MAANKHSEGWLSKEQHGISLTEPQTAFAAQRLSDITLFTPASDGTASTRFYANQ